ncbi:methyltransferase domain-containing protein [Natronosporangium hydrolyticum]|uniref:Protein-L-isoaspartate O-methyltransferase n=1 Tax=Natronosporangium hydrolyticum TaxID=2811111 RepID=A0A895YA25_9ACTN|nr:methyltransferase domain-containing protein [Natronosporangium hydrolyticum]QSB14597.1 methyltransferase domain-containing protein [Natronosporangium hydrolyticum]
MIDWERLAKELAEAVAADVNLEAPWREAITRTPRHHFVPRFWDLDQNNNPTELVDGAHPDHRERWLTACYRNQVLITQWHGQRGRRIITSSASMPSLVAQMLQTLDVHDGNRVLEIGTGTGYNTALLCNRLGHAAVASVDIDPLLAAEAQQRLNRLGYQPVVEASDGANGLPSAAPYDRILSTCSAATVPAAWIDQLTDGGLIVAPLTYGGALAVLRKTALGEVSGHLAAEQAYFMPLHAAGEPMPNGFVPDLPQLSEIGASHEATTAIPLKLWNNPDWRLWLALHLPHGHIADLVNEHMDRTGAIVYTADRRAQVDYAAAEPGRWPVTQDRDRLWDTVEAAWQSWTRFDEPDRTRIGITARSDGQQWVWIDEPDQPVPVHRER